MPRAAWRSRNHEHDEQSCGHYPAVACQPTDSRLQRVTPSRNRFVTDSAPKLLSLSRSAGRRSGPGAGTQPCRSDTTSGVDSAQMAARSKSGSMRTWRSSARGAGPSASRRSCSLRSTCARFTRGNASTQGRLEFLGWRLPHGVPHELGKTMSRGAPTPTRSGASVQVRTLDDLRRHHVPRAPTG
jgi:hypothetical protein